MAITCPLLWWLIVVLLMQHNCRRMAIGEYHMALPSLNVVDIANIFVITVLVDNTAERSAVAFSSTSIAVYCQAPPSEWRFVTETSNSNLQMIPPLHPISMKYCTILLPRKRFLLLNLTSNNARQGSTPPPQSLIGVAKVAHGVTTGATPGATGAMPCTTRAVPRATGATLRTAGAMPHTSMTGAILPPSSPGSSWSRSSPPPHPSAFALVVAAMGDAAGGTQGEAEMAGCKRTEGVKDMARACIAGKIIAPQRESNKQAKQAKSK
jgi:hypothetical protein